MQFQRSKIVHCFHFLSLCLHLNIYGEDVQVYLWYTEFVAVICKDVTLLLPFCYHPVIFQTMLLGL